MRSANSRTASGSAEALGDHQRVRCARYAVGQAEGRLHALDVEAHRRGAQPLVAHGERLDGFVVRRDRQRRALLAERVDDAAGERGALLRVGARGELVEQHERIARPRPRGSRVRLVMCAENVDRLRAVDCSSPTSVSTRSKKPTVLPAVGGDRQAVARHQRAQPERLEQHGLAARVRARDHEPLRPRRARGRSARRRYRRARAAGGARP